MAIIQNALKCMQCENILEKPTILPCGESVCRKHVLNVKNAEFYCKLCNGYHRVPGDGFPANKALEKLLNIGSNYSEAMESCRTLENMLADLTVFTTDPDFYINDTISLLRNQAEIKREEAKLRVDQEAEQLINELNSYEEDCKKHVRHDKHLKARYKRLEKSLAEIKRELDSWFGELDGMAKDGADSTIQIRENKWGKIKIESEKRTLIIAAEIENLKRELLMNKLDEFKPTENKTNLETKEVVVIPRPKSSPNVRCFDSKILETTEFENRLLKLCTFPKNLEWTLLYRGSQDGFSSRRFHSKCDGFSNTLVVVKATTGNIFGGYTESTWDQSYESKCDPNAFIFSLVNEDANPIKIKILPDKDKFAIRCNPNYGPIFGSGVGNDFAICSEANRSSESFSNLGVCFRHPSYTVGSNEAKRFLAGSYKFTISEIEVFQFIWDYSH